jgi:hypothetical protein
MFPLQKSLQQLHAIPFGGCIRRQSRQTRILPLCFCHLLRLCTLIFRRDYGCQFGFDLTSRRCSPRRRPQCRGRGVKIQWQRFGLWFFRKKDMTLRGLGRSDG